MLYILFLFLIPISSIKMQCSPPHKHAPTIPDARLVSMALFLRHGLRTPTDSHFYISKSEIGNWVCDSEYSEAPRNHFSIYPENSNSKSKVSRRYFNQLDANLVEYPPNCQQGDLLVQGMKQLYDLGQFYQQYLIHELRFLPRIIHPEYMELRSSYVERTFRSGESFMAGLYPPVTPNERITFMTGSDSSDYLTTDPAFCQELQKDCDYFGNSEELKQRIEEDCLHYKDIYNALNITYSSSNWMLLGDYLSLLYCTDQKFPSRINKLIDDKIFNRTQSDLAFYYYGCFNVTKGVASAPIFRDLFRMLEEKNSEKRFFLFSAHDTTIMSILSTFDYTDTAVPTFGSHLALEFWEKPKGSGKKYIRMVLNGEEIAIGDDGKTTLMEYNQFKEKLVKIGMNRFCKEYP